MHKSVNARESYPGDTVRHPTKWLWGPCGRGFLNEPEKGGAATPPLCTFCHASRVEASRQAALGKAEPRRKQGAGQRQDGRGGDGKQEACP